MSVKAVTGVCCSLKQAQIKLPHAEHEEPSMSALAQDSDCVLQVGLKMQFQGSQGQLMFFFGNKGDSLLERLICVVPPSGQFAFQQGPVPSQLEPKKQVQVIPLADSSVWPCLLACRSAFVVQAHVVEGLTLHCCICPGACPCVAARCPRSCTLLCLSWASACITCGDGLSMHQVQ